MTIISHTLTLSATYNTLSIIQFIKSELNPLIDAAIPSDKVINVSISKSQSSLSENTPSTPLFNEPHSDSQFY
jgi:hypothetical protein